MTKSTKPSIGAVMPDWQAAMALALMLAVFAIGWRIPLPGLDFNGTAPSFLPDNVAARLSIFALGVTPLFTTLAYVEIAKLAVPPLARWQAASALNARNLAVIVFSLSLMLAAMQGYGVLVALGATGLVRPEAVGFTPAGLACYIASTVLIIWLADSSRFTELGSGFWPLMAVLVLANFPDRLSPLIELVQTGAIRVEQLLVVGLCLVAGIALVVFANLLLSRNLHPNSVAKTSILLWPPYLASVVAGYALLLLPTEMPDWQFATTSFYRTAHLTLTVICIPVFVFAYARSFRLSSPAGLRPWPRPILLAVAAIQIILCVGAELLPIYWNLLFSMSGGELLVLGTVMLALLGSATRAA